jgi:hypothetical protein
MEIMETVAGIVLALLFAALALAVSSYLCRLFDRVTGRRRTP